LSPRQWSVVRPVLVAVLTSRRRRRDGTVKPSEWQDRTYSSHVKRASRSPECTEAHLDAAKEPSGARFQLPYVAALPDLADNREPHQVPRQALEIRSGHRPRTPYRLCIGSLVHTRSSSATTRGHLVAPRSLRRTAQFARLDAFVKRHWKAEVAVAIVGAIATIVVAILASHGVVAASVNQRAGAVRSSINAKVASEYRTNINAWVGDQCDEHLHRPLCVKLAPVVLGRVERPSGGDRPS
jgi:hypothetical protein